MANVLQCGAREFIDLPFSGNTIETPCLPSPCTLGSLALQVRPRVDPSRRTCSSISTPKHASLEVWRRRSTRFPLPFMVVGFGDGTQNRSWRRLTSFEDCHVQCTCPSLRRSRPLGFRRCQFLSNAHLLSATWPDAVPEKGSVGKQPEVRIFGGTLRAQP